MKYVSLFFILPLLVSCSAKGQYFPARPDNADSFVVKVAKSPVNQPVMITEDTVFGNNFTLIVGELYNSASGKVCRHAKILEQERVFAVCNDTDSAAEDNWILVPAVQ